MAKDFTPPPWLSAGGSVRTAENGPGLLFRGWLFVELCLLFVVPTGDDSDRGAGVPGVPSV